MLKQLIDAFEMDQCLVFCHTRLDCNNIHHYLTKLGGGRAFRGAPDAGADIQNKYVIVHKTAIIISPID